MSPLRPRNSVLFLLLQLHSQLQGLEFAQIVTLTTVVRIRLLELLDLR